MIEEDGKKKKESHNDKALSQQKRIVVMHRDKLYPHYFFLQHRSLFSNELTD